MKKGLVIVESPTKVRTLKRYLGKEYEIKASVGHVIDLPPKRLGVDVEHDFAPEYEVIRGKGKIIKELKSAAAKVDDVYLAPDPDREGEAIAWHIAEKLKGRQKPKKFHRVLFFELTERAIREAMSRTGKLDRNKFESQQARRILDRLVGYEISPLLWEKVRRGLSAGRVQSVAVRIICDREREIQAFVPEEYWSVTAKLHGPEPPAFEAKVSARRGKKLAISSGEDARAIVARLKGAEFKVKSLKTRERKRKPYPPFITSTMQQEAARRLGFPARKTMMLAQRLYEGIELGDEGPVGLITYMRTDSTRIADEAIQEARSLIKKRFGDDFMPRRAPRYKKGKLSQDAHEAIRPTSATRTPSEMKSYLDKDASALYELIWKRFVASQMSPAVIDQTSVDIEAGEYLLRAAGSVVRFPGFTVLYAEAREESQSPGEETPEKTRLPKLSEGDPLKLLEVTPKQHFTQPPPRFTEASLIRTLEERGIGRPSTYAAILSRIREMEYVRLEKRRFVPTELGMLVTDLLVAHFPEILDTRFTAEMEKELDEVEEGTFSWVDVLRNFYDPFSHRMEKARREMKAVKREGIETGITCEKCGAPMVIKYGKSGEFLACSAFPACRNTKEFRRDEKGTIIPLEEKPEKVGTCEKCGRDMIVKKGRFGSFIACSGYPECINTKPLSSGASCPEPGCSGELVQRRSKSGKLFYGCSRYPECTYATWDQPISRDCPLCGSKVLLLKESKRTGKILRCPRKGCRYKAQIEDGHPAAEK